jgi:hypothetical protein
MTEAPSDYDNPWKLVLETYLQDFFAFFFPDILVQIDWSQPHEFLDKEFQQVVREAELGKRLVDKLVKVWRCDGEEAWVLVHVEVQSQEESGFAERMYIYNYRIYDRYNRQVASLAVLGDERSTWRPRDFGYEIFGCQVQFQFPIVKLLDYADQWQSLEESQNPFATVVMAHLKTQETRDNGEERKNWKLFLIKRLYEKGFQRLDIQNLFRFIDWLMALPDAIDEQFWQELTRYEEERRMPYITGVERRAIQTGQRLVIENIFKVRFGDLDDQLFSTIPALLELPAEEFTPLLMQLSREELLARFQPL